LFDKINPVYLASVKTGTIAVQSTAKLAAASSTSSTAVREFPNVSGDGYRIRQNQSWHLRVVDMT